MVGPLAGLLTETIDAVKDREQTALDSLLREHDGRCVLYGAGTLGRKAVALFEEIGVKPLALVDRSADRWGTEVSGVKVMSAEDAARQFGSTAVFFVTVWNDFHWFSDTQRKLTALGCVSISSYAPIFWRFGDRFMDLLLLNEPPHRLYEDRSRVLEAESIWADEESLATYRANILWRAKGDPSHLPFPAPPNTYFPPDLFQLTSAESVVDCGAFDGDTLRMFLSVSASLEAFYAIEADVVSLSRLRSYVAGLPPQVAERVHEMDCAVGRERCTLQFVMTGALTSRAGDQDGAEATDVPCLPLDELFADRQVTFIKMDIEGAEFDALLGGSNIIQRDSPILAICVYHTQNDIWRIPLLMRSLDSRYKLFLRSYDGDGFQSVVYAVPPDRLRSQ